MRHGTFTIKHQTHMNDSPAQTTDGILVIKIRDDVALTKAIVEATHKIMSGRNTFGKSGGT